MNGQKIIFKAVPLVLAAILGAISLVLLGGVQGYKEGLMADIEPSVLAGFSSHGPNIFEFVGEKYLLIAVCCLIFVVGKLITERTSSAILCFSATLGNIFFYWRLLVFKYDIDDSAVLLYRDWLNITLQLDWACLFLVILLTVIELVGFTTLRGGPNGPNA